MGFFKVLIISFIVIVALAWIFPNAYLNSKSLILNIVGSGDSTGKLKFTETAEGKDYGKIFGFFDCKDDEHCLKYFPIEGITCSVNKTCILAGVE